MFKSDRTLTIEDIISSGKQRAGICPICKEYFRKLTEHHIRKKMLWGCGNNNQYYTIYICEYCHPEVEREITRREGIVLRERLETIYEDVILSFVEGSIEVKHFKKGKYRR